jgi:hypothetical protein
MRIKFTALIVAILMILAIPAYAGGTVNCGSLGHGYTTAGAGSAGNRDHYMPDFGGTTVGEGTLYHGTLSGSVSWDVTGSGAESAVCPQ